MSVGSLLSVHRVHVPQLVTGLHHRTYVIARFVNYPCMHCPYSGSYPQDTFNPLKGPNSLASTQNIKSSQLRNISEYCINVTITHEIGPESSNGEGGGVSGHNGETGMTCPPVLPRIRGGRRYGGIGSEQSGAMARRVPAPFPLSTWCCSRWSKEQRAWALCSGETPLWTDSVVALPTFIFFQIERTIRAFLSATTIGQHYSTTYLATSIIK